jgi:hypothetical protein
MTSLQEQIAVLKSVGIELAPDTTIDDLMNDGWGEFYESDAYVSLLCNMGMSEKLSTDVWHFDTECIEGPGSYAYIARRLAILSEGMLPLEQIEDEVNNNGIETGMAWLSFVLHGQFYKWDLKIENDWVDAEVFTRFVQLNDQQNPLKRFILFGLGQDGLIAYATPQQLESLNQQTGLEFIWLT